MVIPGNSAGRSAKSVTCEEIAAKVGFDRTTLDHERCQTLSGC